MAIFKEIRELSAKLNEIMEQPQMLLDKLQAVHQSITSLLNETNDLRCSLTKTAAVSQEIRSTLKVLKQDMEVNKEMMSSLVLLTIAIAIILLVIVMIYNMLHHRRASSGYHKCEKFEGANLQEEEESHDDDNDDDDDAFKSPMTYHIRGETTNDVPGIVVQDLKKKFELPSARMTRCGRVVRPPRRF